MERYAGIDLASEEHRFSIVDGEWPAIRTALESWLAASNFDESGEQRRRLGDFLHTRGG